MPVNILWSIQETATILNCTSDNVRRLVMEDRTLEAVRVMYDGNQHTFSAAVGLQRYAVDSDGAVTHSDGGAPAGVLRFRQSEVIRFLSEWAHGSARAVAAGLSLESMIDCKKPLAKTDDQTWTQNAKKRALEIIARQRQKDLFPSQKAVADEIAAEFRANGTFGAGGKPLTGAYIKRHALKGISSEQGKQLSTKAHRGK